jgi:hypothetical protein
MVQNGRQNITSKNGCSEKSAIHNKYNKIKIFTQQCNTNKQTNKQIAAQADEMTK